MIKCFAFAALALTGLLVAQPLQAATALFCENCTSNATAQEEARRHAPALHCYAPNPDEFMTPDNQVCFSAAKKLVLANPNSRQLYTYMVGHQSSSPWSVTVSSAQLSAEETENYLKTIDFYNDYKQAVEAAQQQLNQSSFTLPSAAVAPMSASQCPENTALNTLINPDKMQGLEDWITYSIMQNFQGNVHDYFDTGARVNSVGITIAGTGGTIGWNERTRRPYFIQGFNESEVPFDGVFQDTLVLEMELAGFNGNVPNILFKVHGSSRVAGYSLARWQGQSGSPGGVTVTNSCVQERLAQLANVPGGEFRRPDGTPSGFGPGAPVPGDGGGNFETCTIYFYQSGRLLYVFAVPMGQC